MGRLAIGRRFLSNTPIVFLRSVMRQPRLDPHPRQRRAVGAIRPLWKTSCGKIEQVSHMCVDAERELQNSLEIRVRRALLSDYPKIAIFLREAYGDLAPFKGKQRWYWQFVDNPYIDDNNVPVWIAETDEKIVGQIAVQRGAIELDGSTHSAGLDCRCHDTALVSRIWTRPSALWRWREYCPLLFTLTMAEATRRLAERIGAIDLSEVKLYWRGTRLDHVTVQRYLLACTRHHPGVQKLLRALCRYFLLHSILSVASNLFFSLRDSLVPLPRVRKDTLIVETNGCSPESMAYGDG